MPPATLRFSTISSGRRNAVATGRQALAAGAPILVDSRMVAAGITGGRLPGKSDIICTLHAPKTAGLAEALKTTRSAAAVELWRPHLAAAVVAIGNAPTALFHLLEMIAGGAPKPALVLGFPVGFVGAAEAKAALATSRGHRVHRAARPPGRQRARGRRGQRAGETGAVTAWLTVIGIGEDGMSGLAPAARALVETAEMLVGGARHLAMVPPRPAPSGFRGDSRFADSVADIAAHRGRRVVVLASGDPLWYGVGAMLARHFAREEMTVAAAAGRLQPCRRAARLGARGVRDA